MRAPRKQLVVALGRTKTLSYHTNELGRLLLLTVPTGPIKCANERISNKTILSGERQTISSGHMPIIRAQLLFYVVQLFASQIHKRSSL
jgi:hypothetical protein